MIEPVKMINVKIPNGLSRVLNIEVFDPKLRAYVASLPYFNSAYTENKYKLKAFVSDLYDVQETIAFVESLTLESIPAEFSEEYEAKARFAATIAGFGKRIANDLIESMTDDDEDENEGDAG